MKIAKTHQKQQVTIPDILTENAPSGVFELTHIVLDIFDFLCSEDRDVEELVNETKPKLEMLLRRFQ